MIDLFAVITTGGIILWAHSAGQLVEYRDLLAKFMQSVLVEASEVGKSMIFGAYELQWNVHRELGLIFLTAYQKVLPLTYIPLLMENVKSLFVKKYSKALEEEPFVPITDFDADFDQVLRIIEATSSNKGKVQSSVVKTQSTKQKQPEIEQKRDGPSSSLKPGKKKTMRDWGDRVKEEDLQALDFSEPRPSPHTPTPSTISLPSGQDFTLIQDLTPVESITEQKASDSRLWKMFGSLTGRKTLDADDLKEPLEAMREHLVNKNVAAEVSEVICTTVKGELVGKATGAFGSIGSMVRGATETAVNRLLQRGQDRHSTDVLGEIRALGGNRPYVMAFVGVNGVGKSTNLAKICFWLLQNKLRVLLVAGDTFRSGAVEQLRTHVRNLSSAPSMAGRVELFERGYGKDAAAVAKDAIRAAQGRGFDVVMVDTAGRMQDNVPLMAALAKLVYMNEPDQIIFVGEALVGNEAVDQLKKFNQALQDHAPPHLRDSPRRINGIVLTKFDTIDDKVGAALSMTFIARAPILFVGVGQTYTDLRKLNVPTIVATLLK